MEPAAVRRGADFYLSNIDDDQYFRDIIATANRANARSTPIDPRGLPVFDTAIGPEPPPTIVADARHAPTPSRHASHPGRRHRRHGGAETVMISTSASNASPTIFRPTTFSGTSRNNARLDGKYHTIKVRVKRPGIDVRARKGYRSATAEEVCSGTKSGEPANHVVKGRRDDGCVSPVSAQT
jgi:hypothetical protein